MTRPRRVLLWLMGMFYVVAGAIHFLNPGFYLPMMPPYLPLHRELVYLSGLAEMVLGVAVLVPSARRAAAWGIILLLVEVFPANIHIALHDVPVFGAKHGAGIWNWVRLPLQGVLIAWACWYTGRKSTPASGSRAPIARARDVSVSTTGAPAGR
jgi:uncharacterized membrane protein